MTDHQKLLVALRSASGDERDQRITTSDIVSLLYEIGAEHRRTPQTTPHTTHTRRIA